MRTHQIPNWVRFGPVVLLGALALVVSGASPAASQKGSPSGSAASGDSPEAHLGKGYAALKNDRYEVAASEFRAALALDPKLVLRARFPLAVALFELHKAEEARREFEAVRREVGDHPNVLYYLGRLDLTEGKFEDAIRKLSEAAAQPPFSDTAYHLGFAYFKQGDLPSAEKWLREAAQLEPQDARAQYQLGLLYRKEGREEEAKKTLARSEELRQRDAEVSRLRIGCGQKLEQSSLEEARLVCEQLYDPNDADKLTMLGTIYGGHGDFAEALKPLRRAAELSPHSPQMQYNLALAYFRMGRFEEARAPLQTAVERWPDLFDLNALYGAVLAKLGLNLPAYQALHHAYELNPADSGNTNLLYVVALALARESQSTKQYATALRYLKEAAWLRPGEAEPHQRMAKIYRLIDQRARAEEEQRAIERLSTPGPVIPR